MPDLPELDDTDIEAWVGPTSYRRGYSYYRNGAAFDLRLQGSTLKARCQGSMPDPYAVEVTLGSQGIEAAECSCPVGEGGSCKHVAAVLLTWLHESEQVVEVEPLDSVLERLSREELVAAIRRMIARHPDLETILELPIPGSTTTREPVSIDMIRRQVNNAFRQAGREWGAASRVAHDLQDIVALGNEYAKQGNLDSAQTVYEIVARGVLENYNIVQDEEGDLNRVVSTCVSGLGNCLVQAQNSLQREMILKTLFDIYRWDVDYGSIGMGDEVPDIITEKSTLEEKRRIATWVRDALAAVRSEDSGWRRAAFGGFLLDLEQETLGDETFLAICRDTGRTGDLIDRLLTLGRLDEAEAAARAEESDYNLLSLAGIFVSHNQGTVAERLVRERTRANNDLRLADWLREQAEARGDLAEALRLTDGMFWQQPALPRYQKMRELARLLDRWDALRQDILARLASEGRYAMLTQIYLDEQLIDSALDAVIRIPQQGSRWAGGWSWYEGADLPIKVAQAAEQTRPRDSIQLYTAEAERLIASRSRGSYPTAVQYLIRVRDLYRRIGEPIAWETYLADLRVRTKQLRALRADMDEAKL